MLPHSQSPIVLYTELDAECDQQVTVVSRLLEQHLAMFSPPVPSIVNNRLTSVTRLSRVWDRVIEEVPLFFFKFLQTQCRINQVKPACEIFAQLVHPFLYNTSL